MRIMLGITGASGAAYGLSLLEELSRLEIETHLIVSRWARQTIITETDYTYDQVASLAGKVYEADEMTAGPASGSFIHQGMIIAPCSMKTLAAIASGYTDNLITRAADVTIKERRPLVLLVRETPLNPIHLENMLKLARLGVIIMPPVPALYTRPASIQDILRHTTGRVLDIIGVENNLSHRWGS
ncbi:MAG: UbiX family flavin prenyltransferase [Bacillota bacterium]